MKRTGGWATQPAAPPAGCSDRLSLAGCLRAPAIKNAICNEREGGVDNKRKRDEASSAVSADSSEAAVFAKQFQSHAFSLDYQAWLQRTIESELVPRLMLAHRGDNPQFQAFSSADAHLPTAIDVSALTDRLLHDDETLGRDFVFTFSEREVSLADVMLKLLAPAAREMGERWTADQCDFTAVTLGMWRVHSIIHELSLDSPAPFEYTAPPVGRVLVAVVPGSDHTLGALMLTEFFRRAGWDVSFDPDASLAQLEKVLGSDRFDLVGLSVSRDCHLQDLPSVMLALRRASRHASMGVMVGGPALLNDPEQALRLGADLTALDAQAALEQAQDWISRFGAARG
jgi:methanogenic corrinoid protein MtbC1